MPGYRSKRKYRRTSRKGGRSLRRRSGYRKSSKGRRFLRGRRGMSRKALLNVTSRKKRDTMLSYTNVSTSSQIGSANYVVGPAVLAGGAQRFFLWCATARGISTYNNFDASLIDQSSRTATNCYMRGLKERIRISTDDGMPWLWRRICFTSRNLNLRGYQTGAGTSYSPAFLTSAGFMRGVNQPYNDSYINDLLWKGTLGKDWNDFMTATVDNRRVDVKYDKTTTIAAGNEEGCIREFNRWHPMNKSLVYDDEEAGDEAAGSVFSVTDKRGMGDYYVMDIFDPRSGSTSASHLSFRPDATLYWHER
ncbi:capsid protein [Faeces associated gemycircularvirus 10]|uniref:Capsid protein n=1 Tax=Faeces associated gemycircularvirus 10 TaxID=1391025 RepID=T1YRV6_9VIRU|nr:capsid protein [Faeces associated gemycircularvirus 10]AGU67650.1 capsid protein [Faeces associated gemycircularvirus 10]